MFELTAFIDRQRKQKLVGAIKEASRLIADCPDPQRFLQLAASAGTPTVSVWVF